MSAACGVLGGCTETRGHSAYVARLAAELEDQVAGEQLLGAVDLAAVEVLLARTAPGQQSPTS